LSGAARLIHRPRPPDRDTPCRSASCNVRAANIHGFYAAARAKGTEFLTPPIDRCAEPRRYRRDPDGYLIEAGQVTGTLKGILARTGTETRPLNGTSRERRPS
jgi:hypothetical protein